MKLTEGVNFINILQSVSRITLTKQTDYFQVKFDHFLIERHFKKAPLAVLKIGSSLKQKHDKEI